MNTLEQKKYKVFGHHAEQTGVGYYRIIRPSMNINTTDKIEVHNFPFIPEGRPPDLTLEECGKIIDNHDLLWFSRVDSPHLVVLMKAIRSLSSYKRDMTILMEDRKSTRLNSI